MSKESASLPPDIISLCEDSSAPVSHICTENREWLHVIARSNKSTISTLSELCSINPDADKIEHLLLYQAFESVPRANALPILAQLRDRRCKLIHIGLEHSHASNETAILPQDLAALGFTCIHQYPFKNHAFHLFRFSLYNYKRTPDWLNSRFWANPERWDKTRW